MTKNLTPCLWFDDQAEAAAEFYTSVFPNSRITRVTRLPEGAPRPAGMVMTVEFELDGKPFMALNGGPEYQHSPALSFVVDCRTQDEVDHYWDRLVAGGQPVQCGWLTDRFGLSWQVIPSVLIDLMTSSDPARGKRVTEAMHTMTKLDLAALQRAHDGVQA
jgi:predicted 3-demethylubiquinone-9 3-methyltransferase (glyoxalase superfamily)